MADATGQLTPEFLSGSTNGRGIKVAATATPGTTLHAASAGTTDMEYVTIVANNTHSASVLLTIEFGGTTDPDDHIEVNIGSQRGLQVICDRMPINNGLTIAAFASVADVVVCFGEIIKERL